MTIETSTTTQTRQINLPEGVPPLTTYYYYLTAGCNLACQHCWITPTFQKNGGTGGHLSFELFKQSIEEGLPLGLSSVKLTGGEPLLHPDLKEILTYCHEKQVGVTIETNGTLLTPELAQHMRDTNVNFVSVSLDGATAKTHDPFRGVIGSFDAAVQGIKYLVEAGYRPQVIMSIHEGNVHEIEDLVHLAEDIGSGSVKFNLIQPTGRAQKMKNGEILDVPKLIEIGNWIDKEFYKTVSIPLFYSWPIAFWSLHRLANESIGTCHIHNILGVLSTGHLAMCGIGVNVPELVYGKLGVDDVETVWSENPMLQHIREEIPDKLEGVCGECLFKNTCLGSCVAQNYFLESKLTSSFWFCEEASKLALFNDNRLIINKVRKV